MATAHESRKILDKEGKHGSILIMVALDTKFSNGLGDKAISFRQVIVDILKLFIETI